MYGCRYITDSCLSYLSHVQFLEDLDLSLCSITDQGIKTLFSIYSSHNLRCLSLYGCVHITDQSFIYLQTYAMHLKKLNLFGLPLITFEGLGKLIRHCTYLAYLDIGGCSQINFEQKQFIQQQLCKIRI